jgi:biopolymer transport protein ExbB
MEWLVDIVDYGVIGLLFVLCFVVVGLALERWLFFRKIDLSAYSRKQELELEICRNLQFIGTVAGNAPYLGLLGTVLGIMLTFHNIGLNASINTTSIMISLALALKATAVGLVVAIIAVMLYNSLTRKAKNLVLRWEMRHEG